jgi:hypothetical protein
MNGIRGGAGLIELLFSSAVAQIRTGTFADASRIRDV